MTWHTRKCSGGCGRDLATLTADPAARVLCTTCEPGHLSVIPRGWVSDHCQWQRHGQCDPDRPPVSVDAVAAGLSRCQCPRHLDPSEPCWSSLDRVEVRGAHAAPVTLTVGQLDPMPIGTIYEPAQLPGLLRRIAAEIEASLAGHAATSRDPT